jgi:hypothetical protein
MGEIKTMAGWGNNKFRDYFKKGDEVDEDVYNYFLNILPPFSLRGGQGYYAGFQVSEPDSDGIDVNGEMRALYSTFGAKNERYYYLGLNFKGEVDSKYEPWTYVVWDREVDACGQA